MAQTIGGGVLNPLNPKVRGAAVAAGKLTSAHTIQTDLGSSVAVGFDGSKDITPGVKGILPVVNGGTGASTAAAARAALEAAQGTSTVLSLTFNNTTVSDDRLSYSKTVWENILSLPISLPCFLAIVYNSARGTHEAFDESLPTPSASYTILAAGIKGGNRGFMLAMNNSSTALYCASVNDKTPTEWKKIV